MGDRLENFLVPETGPYFEEMSVLLILLIVVGRCALENILLTSLVTGQKEQLQWYLLGLCEIPLAVSFQRCFNEF